MFDTTEGPMELDFDAMELYQQRGDLLCPMVKMVFTERMWMAESPSGAAYVIEQENGSEWDTVFYTVYRIKSCKMHRITHKVSFDYISIGQSGEYNVNN